MKEELREYILNLNQKRDSLKKDLAEIENELEEIKSLSSLFKEAATRTIKCPTCRGTGETWHMLDGNVECRDCNGTGRIKENY